MRRRLSWAVLGTSGVLAVVVATMINTGEPEEVASPKIIVPMADDAVIDLPAPPVTTRPSTVFIDVPPVAVTSQPATPPPVAPVQPTVVAPKKVTPTAKPVVPVPTVKLPPVVSAVVPQPSPQSIWRMYSGYRNYYGGGYYGPNPYGGGYYGGNGYGGYGYGGGYPGGGR